MKAYKVYIPGEPETEGITRQKKRSHAIMLALGNSQEAGYSYKWTDFRAVRSPEFDNVKGLERGLYIPEAAQSMKTNKL